jgi:hypothetical protein
VVVNVSDSPKSPQPEKDFSSTSQLVAANSLCQSRHDQDILDIIPNHFFTPPPEPIYHLSPSVVGNAMKIMFTNHRQDLQLVTDRLATTVDTVTKALTTTTELVSSQMATQLEQSRTAQEQLNKTLQEINKSNQEFLLKMMQQFRS